jgi:hypothetical protein
MKHLPILIFKISSFYFAKVDTFYVPTKPLLKSFLPFKTEVNKTLHKRAGTCGPFYQLR